jgi:DNA-directed RNA polymerase subunit H
MQINFKDLPKITNKDPAILEIAEVKSGDIIKITRKSSTAKETVFYRGVIDA